MRQSLRSGWLAVLLLSGGMSGETWAQSSQTAPSSVRPAAAGAVEISDLRPTAGVHSRRPVASGPKLLEVESGVELQPIESPRPGSRPPAKTAARPTPKTRVIEIPSEKAEKTAPEKLSPESDDKPSDEAGPSVGPMADDAIELDRRILALRDRLRKTLDYYYHRKLNTRENTHWEVMHQIVAYGVKAEVRKNSARGEPVNAISWLCWNQQCFGEKMLYTMGGLPAARQGPRVQGHEGQFLKMLAMSGVSPDYPMMVDGKSYKVADLIEQEKLTCKTKMELTFKLISLAYYLEDLDETWRGRDGQEWSIERLIREELTQPILRDAACGGTHRLMGFSMALRQRRRAGQPVDGEFERAEKYINDYVKYTLGLQNSDGSFSTEWFRRREADPSLDRRLQTSGHILEWLVFTVPDEMLVDARILRGVEYVARILDEGRSRQWEIGPLGHALHALSIYERRVSYLESQEVEETPETEPAPEKLIPEKKAPEKTPEKKVAPEKKSAPEKVAPEKSTEKSAPEKKTPEKAEPEKSLPQPQKKAVKGPIKLPPDAKRMDEVEAGPSKSNAGEKGTEKSTEKGADKKAKEPAEKGQAEKKPAAPKLELPKASPKRELKKPAPKAKAVDEDEVPVVEKAEPTGTPKSEEKTEQPKTEQPKSDPPKAEEPKTKEPQSEQPAAEKKSDEPQAAEKNPSDKPAEKAEGEAEPTLPEGEPKLPGVGEPTPADPEEKPAAEKPAEKPAVEKPAAGDAKSEPQATPKSEEEPKPAEPKAEEPKSAEPKSEDPKAESDQPKVIKSAPVEQSEPAKKEVQDGAEGEPLPAAEPTPAEEPQTEAKSEPAQDKPAADKPEGDKTDGAAPKFKEPKFDLDPLADPTSGARREPRTLELDDLSRVGRLPPVDGAEDIRTAAPRRSRPTAPDLWESPVFDAHREGDDSVAHQAKPLPAPPVEAVDSPSQPVARVAGRTLRPARNQQGESESTFPKILKRRLGILFVPKSIVPAR